MQDAELLDNFFACSQRIDAVIHFAGFKAVGESVKNPLKIDHLNGVTVHQKAFI